MTGVQTCALPILLLKHVDYMVRLVGIDNVGICAQDDWHRSRKDVHRIQPYLPGYDSVAGKAGRKFGSDYRIYRMEDQLGPDVLTASGLGAQLTEIYGAHEWPDPIQARYWWTPAHSLGRPKQALRACPECTVVAGDSERQETL